MTFGQACEALAKTFRADPTAYNVGWFALDASDKEAKRDGEPNRHAVEPCSPRARSFCAIGGVARYMGTDDVWSVERMFHDYGFTCPATVSNSSIEAAIEMLETVANRAT